MAQSCVFAGFGYMIVFIGKILSSGAAAFGFCHNYNVESFRQAPTWPFNRIRFTVMGHQ